jgi:hypothetical protein
MMVSVGQLFGANLNRSPSSYDKNKPELLELYPEGNTDKHFTVLYTKNRLLSVFQHYKSMIFIKKYILFKIFPRSRKNVRKF